MTVPLFLPHTGAHCAAHGPSRAALFFRRLAGAWRKPAVPEVPQPASGTVAPALPAPPVLTDREIAALTPRHASSERINCGGRLTVDVPRRKPLDGRAPWPVTPTAELAMLTDAVTLAMYQGDWGTKPGADVLEGERLASVTLP